MAIGLFLLSLMSPTTPLVVSSIYMFVVGLGIGLVMQVLVVAVQNAVPYSQLGTTTSAATFFRTIGGAFGVALFGTIFNNRLFAELPHYLPASVVHRLAGHNISSNPAQINALPPADPRGVRAGLQPLAQHRVPGRGALRDPGLRAQPLPEGGPPPRPRTSPPTGRHGGAAMTEVAEPTAAVT